MSGRSSLCWEDHNQRDMNSTTLFISTGRLTSDLSGRLSTVNLKRSLSEVIQSHGSPFCVAIACWYKSTSFPFLRTSTMSPNDLIELINRNAIHREMAMNDTLTSLWPRFCKPLLLTTLSSRSSHSMRKISPVLPVLRAALAKKRRSEPPKP